MKYNEVKNILNDNTSNESITPNILRSIILDTNQFIRRKFFKCELVVNEEFTILNLDDFEIHGFGKNLGQAIRIFFFSNHETYIGINNIEKFKEVFLGGVDGFDSFLNLEIPMAQHNDKFETQALNLKLWEDPNGNYGLNHKVEFMGYVDYVCYADYMLYLKDKINSNQEEEESKTK